MLSKIDTQSLDVSEVYQILSPEYGTEYPDLTFKASFWVTIGTNSDGSYRVNSIEKYEVIWFFGYLSVADSVIPTYSMTQPYYWGTNNNYITSKVTVSLRLAGSYTPFSTETYTVTAALADSIT